MMEEVKVGRGGAEDGERVEGGNDEESSAESGSDSEKRGRRRQMSIKGWRQKTQIMRW